MSDTDELLREVEERTDDDLGGGLDDRTDTEARDATSPEAEPAAGRTNTTTEADSSSRQGGLRSRLPSGPSMPTVLTPGGLLLALALTVVGFLVGGAVPFIGGVTGLVGIGVAGFLLGVLGRGRYLELALAGAGTGAVAFVLDRLVLSTVAGFALPLTLVGGGVGLVAAVLGLYFGRDLRDGLTRDIEA